MSLMYRRDNRSVEEFEKHMIDCSSTEKEIINLYAEYLKQKHGIEATIKNNGVDNSGKLIKGRVTSDADFLVNGKLIEVKFNRKMSKFFHLKESQVNSYLKQKADILFVNGWETPEPVFAILGKHDLLFLQQGCEPFPFFIWGNKTVYRLYSKDYNWKPLPKEINKQCMKNMILQAK